MILVTGSSGTVGTELLRQLTAQGAKVRAAYRSRRPSVHGVEPARIDLATGEGLDAALAGCDVVFLLTGELTDQTLAELRAVERASRAGVRRIVKLSVWGAETDSYSFARIHRPVERAIESSGMGYTLLRPNSFMQNFVTYEGQTIRSQGAFHLPCRDARVAHVDARDIAAVATRALLAPGGEHEGKAYGLSGPEALTFEECASKLSAAAGRPVRYVDVSEQEFRRSMTDAGAPGGTIEAMIELYRYYVAGKAGRVTTAVGDVTGRAPITFDQFARDYAEALR
jgi:uncharacterized protein YbjT (DUF2867 family)